MQRLGLVPSLGQRPPQTLPAAQDPSLKSSTALRERSVEGRGVMSVTKTRQQAVFTTTGTKQGHMFRLITRSAFRGI